MFFIGEHPPDRWSWHQLNWQELEVILASHMMSMDPTMRNAMMGKWGPRAHRRGVLLLLCCYGLFFPQQPKP